MICNVREMFRSSSAASLQSDGLPAGIAECRGAFILCGRGRSRILKLQINFWSSYACITAACLIGLMKHTSLLMICITETCAPGIFQ
ncbi:hypothetical protein ASPWEDRAFT_470442 [Aspergillus wentii DTO 134E9]|uniref:Uncharacterized protein n=1 Tax=Aspergillus wentii DTO 134E9 TaxID=1073089 RepID=A0A1L9RSH8_ASPWE|nr:uncharacterized protein ASPWEDRAFT_470442 [Aspergillus wentii DTO 134E9]OJJ37798.1 hypothetical protein ASPWEDRAFT_470442 [Aspergillus wentii DTO 134E9]